MGARAVLGAVLTALAVSACDLLPHPGDTLGVQREAVWSQHGRIVADTDPEVTLVHVRIDSTGGTGRRDAVLARFDFDPTPAEGDEYEIVIGLDLGNARDMGNWRHYRIGGAGAPVHAVATVACFCRPLRPDSVRGTYQLLRRGVAQITGRLDARLYFTAWNDTTKHAVYLLRQRIEGVR